MPGNFAVPDTFLRSNTRCFAARRRGAKRLLSDRTCHDCCRRFLSKSEGVLPHVSFLAVLRSMATASTSTRWSSPQRIFPRCVRNSFSSSTGRSVRATRQPSVLQSLPAFSVLHPIMGRHPHARFRVQRARGICPCPHESPCRFLGRKPCCLRDLKISSTPMDLLLTNLTRRGFFQNLVSCLS